MKSLCCKCFRQINSDEVGLTRSYFGRNTVKYYCVDCLAEKMLVDSDSLRGQIEYLREVKPELFPRED